jgi:uncharacterized protein YaeQ
MAINATIFKVDLQIADMDRNYYADHSLTLARHPSETDERMMVRLLAFALYAREGLSFGKGMFMEDEPDLWAKDLTGAIELWIDVGLPDEKWVRKACGRANEVVVFSYGTRTADIWWEQNQKKLNKLDIVAVYNLESTATKALANMAERTMRLQFTVQDGEVLITNGRETVQVEPRCLQPAKANHANR